MTALRVEELIRAERAGREIGAAYGRYLRATEALEEVRKMYGQKSGGRPRALDYASAQRREARLKLEGTIERHRKGPR